MATTANRIPVTRIATAEPSPPPSPLAVGFHLAGCGTALGSGCLDNATLAGWHGVEPAWIERRSGIRLRRVAIDDETTGTLAAAAARQALKRAGGSPPDFLLLATFTPDRALCPTAPAVAYQLGLGQIGALDLNAACAGGVSALIVAASLLASGTARRVLLVAADTTRRHLAPEDLATGILFGDGAAALVLDAAVQRGARILATVFGSDGQGAGYFGEARTQAAAPAGVSMDGRALYRFAVETVPRLVGDLCARAGLAPSQIDRVVLHQANLRMIEAIAAATPIPAERWFVNLGEIGNTAAASVPLALAGCLDQGLLRPGDRVLIAGFGAGLTWAGAAIEWY